MSNAAEPKPKSAGIGYKISGRRRKDGRSSFDVNWQTGKRIPDTLDHWLLVAFRRKSGTVLDREKVREAVRRLKLDDDAGDLL